MSLGPARRRVERWRRILRGVLLVAALVGAGVALGSRALRPRPGVPRVDASGQVKDFNLRDAQDLRHTAGEWRGRSAVVLFALGMDDEATARAAPEIRRLAGTFAPRGVAFYGLAPDPGAAGLVAARARSLGLEFPVLLDPAQVVARQAGVAAAPAAVVLDDDGLVLYCGRIGGPLEAALRAVLADELPAVTRTEPAGRPLPPPSAPAAIDGPVTFNRHVAPILWRNCTPCHHRGDVAPFALVTYRDAAKRAEFLRDITAEGRMPPWKPAPGHGIFRDTLRLTDRERAILAAWADAGAPEGDPADLGEPPSYPDGWRLGTPDLVFTMPEPFPIPAAGTDVFRAFVIPLPPGGDREVVAFEFQPGNRRVVHHSKLFQDPTPASRRRDAADPGPGFASTGAADLNQPPIWEWTPGTTPRLPPPGVGQVLRAGADLVLFVHYHPTGKPEEDRSRVGIYLSRRPLTHHLASIPMGDSTIDIPPGARHHRITLHATLPADAHAFGVMPHGHYLLRTIRMDATLPDGTVRPMLRIDDWDFNWQGQFSYARPVPLPRGTRLDVVAEYDNSADNPANPSSPPRRVRFGPSSTDEMLGCHVQVIPDRPEDRAAFRKKWPSGL